MSVITEFRIRSSKLVLWAAQQECPDVAFEVLQQVGTEPQRPYLFILVDAADPTAFEAAMDADPTVTELERYAEFETEVLFRFRVSEATEVVLYPLWVELGADYLELHWSDGWWHARKRFPDREAVATYRERCEELGVEFELERVYTDERSTATGPLSDEQREALLTAYEAGYFAVPRQASMADVAEELGVSSQAVSERLRRAHQALVDHHLD
ncbi:helix-turn-helix domain-containing protein [Halobacteriales archaeon Cl-PHB]